MPKSAPIPFTEHVVLARDESSVSSRRLALVSDSPRELEAAVEMMSGLVDVPSDLGLGATRHAAGADELQTLEAVQTSGRFSSGSLRDEASVVARLAELRRPAIINFFDRIGSFVLEDIPNRIRLLLSPARRIRRRSELSRAGWWRLLARIDALSARQKTALVVTPYLLAVTLAIFLVERRNVQASDAKAIAPVPQIVEEVLPVPDPPETPAITAAPVAVELPVETPESNRRTLPRRSLLLRRPNAKSRSALSIPKDTTLEVYEAVPAAEGFVMVRVERTGAVGFLSTAHLADRSDAAIDARIEAKQRTRSAKKRRRARRR